MIIAITNKKGGVGKTTVTTNLSYALSMIGKKVLVLDFDYQGSTSSIFYNETSPDDRKADYLFKSKNIDARPAIHPAYINTERVENLHIIPASKELKETDQQIASKLNRQKLLNGPLKKASVDFDFVLIDCPPDLGPLTENAIFSADLILIPVDYSKFSLDGVADLFEVLQEVKENNSYQYRILKNKLNRRRTTTNTLIDEALFEFEKNIFKTIISECEAFNQAQLYEQVIFTYDPKSGGADDFKNLASEIIKLDKEIKK